MRAIGDKRLLPFSAFRVLLGSFVSKEMKDQTLPRAMRVSLFAVCLIRRLDVSDLAEEKFCMINLEVCSDDIQNVMGWD